MFIGGVVFFKDSLNVPKVFGIALALLGLVLLRHPSAAPPTSRPEAAEEP